MKFYCLGVIIPLMSVTITTSHILSQSELSQVKDEINRVQQYEKDIKEKNLLIGKLRHEGKLVLRPPSNVWLHLHPFSVITIY